MPARVFTGSQYYAFLPDSLVLTGNRRIRIPIFQFEFSYEGRTYYSRRVFMAFFEDGFLKCNAPDLEIFVVANNYDELLHRIGDEIDSVWSLYVERSPSNFDSGALELRRALISTFIKV
jgi:hypothetical protein